MTMTSWFIWQVAILLKRETLCKLVQLQAAPEVDMEQPDGYPLNYHYFMALFAEVVETKMRSPEEDIYKTDKIYNWRS